MNKLVLKNIRNTKKFASRIAKTISGGEVVLLIGDLGVGKTTFTKFFAEHLGVKDAVSSPTFTILKEYQGKKYKLYHFDMYRIEDESECEEFGFNDYINNTPIDSIVLVEWPEKVESYLTGKYKEINIKYLDENTREVETNFDF